NHVLWFIHATRNGQFHIGSYALFGQTDLEQVRSNGTVWVIPQVRQQLIQDVIDFLTASITATPDLFVVEQVAGASNEIDRPAGHICNRDFRGESQEIKQVLAGNRSGIVVVDVGMVRAKADEVFKPVLYGVFEL